MWKDVPILGLGISLFLSLLSPALAQDGWVTKKTKSGTVKYKKKTVYEFSGSSLEGKLKSPSGSLINTRKKVKLNRLIELRTDFDDSVEDSSSGAR